jgi:hypothetical protein
MGTNAQQDQNLDKKSDEFTRFDTLLRDVLKVPKKEIREREDRAKRPNKKKTA